MIYKNTIFYASHSKQAFPTVSCKQKVWLLSLSSVVSVVTGLARKVSFSDRGPKYIIKSVIHNCLIIIVYDEIKKNSGFQSVGANVSTYT